MSARPDSHMAAQEMQRHAGAISHSPIQQVARVARCAPDILHNTTSQEIKSGLKRFIELTSHFESICHLKTSRESGS